MISCRIGIVAPPATGHLNPMVALALELQRRGHQVLLFTVADGARRLAELPLELITIGAEAFPLGSVDAAYAELGRLSGVAGLRFSVAYIRRELAMLHDQLPAAITAAGIQLLLVDQLSPAGAMVAEKLAIPFVTTTAERRPTAPAAIEMERKRA